MEQGWDPEVTHFFRKIVKTVSLGSLWLMTGLTAGLFFGLAYRSDRPLYARLIFYGVMIATFIFLLRFLVRTWKKQP